MTIEDFNKRQVVKELLIRKNRGRVGNRRNNPSNLVSLNGPVMPRPSKTRKQTTTSAKAGRKRAIPQRLVSADQVKAPLKKGI